MATPTSKSLLKKTLGKLHLWGGLVSGVVVLVVSLTGCLYVFEEEIRNATQREARFVNVPDRPTRRPLATLTQTALAAHPGWQVEQVRVFAEADRSVLIKLAKPAPKAKKGGKTDHDDDEHGPEAAKTMLAFDPYTGLQLGNTDLEHDWLHTVEELHTSLLLGEVGKWIIKVNVVVFLAMLLTGLYLWWPRRRNQRKLAFRPQLAGKWQVVNYSLHNSLGFYFLLPLLLVTFTGIWWAIKPSQKAVYALLGSTHKPPKKAVSVVRAGMQQMPEALFARVAQTYPGWYEAHLNYPRKPTDCIRLNLRYPHSVVRNQNVFEFDQYAGTLLRQDLYSQYSAGDKVKHANYNLHTGRAFGLVGKVLMLLASLFAATLPITGFLIWYNRAYKKKPAAKPVATAARPVASAKPAGAYRPARKPVSV
jgi:uncharacterized iron-regulated membrane protein